MKYSLAFRLKSYLKFLFNFFIGYGTVKSYIKILAAKRLYKQANAGAYESDDADTIIWQYYPNDEIRRNNMPWDVLLISYVALCKKQYKIHSGSDIGTYRNKTILFTINKDKINYHGFENYAAAYQMVCQQLEEQGNKVYPSYHDVLYWENKIFMYTKFMELGIHAPRTKFYTDFNTLISEEATYPFLIKVPHSSGSYGLFNITDAEYLRKVASDPIIKSNKYYIVQERLNITMDMRVIMVGDEILHFYWRKNNDKTKWRTTSTSAGSSVDFEFFPEQWRQYIIDAFKKTGLTTGAFDVGWQNDDLATEPYFFEVSPSYDINPRTTNQAHLNNYGAYKKELLFKNSFDRMYVEQTHAIKSKAVALFFKQIEEGKK